MSFVEPLDSKVVDQHLQATGYNVLRDQAGGFLVIFAGTSKRPEMQIALSVEGENKVYAIRAHIPERFSADDEVMLLGLINRWNREYRWPKAVLVVNPDGPFVKVWTEMQLPATTGVHSGLIDEFTSTAIRSSDTFFTWLTDQLSLPSVAQLEALFKEVG
jgi:Putative bacterial sensory transduction regulator